MATWTNVREHAANPLDYWGSTGECQDARAVQLS
jgi:hypothetical protein